LDVSIRFLVGDPVAGTLVAVVNVWIAFFEEVSDIPDPWIAIVQAALSAVLGRSMPDS
jgi:hypothetical protein